ncbi:M16 family metallopeptidase [Cognatishimia activa]|uniref:Peptidase M16 inactive domain protein n=1 Tax=Cognatishimia activa TaxID=1715691 RepID=A0A0P1J222_9RHOB|nr:insulinase family protein [Cognatishimia activa]CUI28144.1 Peptidase M16 inactive domain protein [Cognatishimia activa]CUK24265.1 Peptidase M16 inactive domain protein [Cognatishimia activa]
MKHFICGCAVVLLAACQADPEKRVAVETSAAGYEFAHLPIFEKDVTDVTLQIAWPTDFAWRSDVNPFVPYVASQAILSEGAAGLNAQELMEAFNDKNAFGRLHIQTDHVIGELSFPIEHLDFVQSVAKEVLVDPKYTENWLERVKDQVGSNNRNAAKKEQWNLWSAVRIAVLGDSPLYNALTLPEPDLASEVGREDVLDWHKTYLTKAPVAISIAGRISAEEAGDLIDGLLVDLPDAPDLQSTDTEVNFAPLNVYFEWPDAEKTQVGMLSALPALTERKDHLDLIALNTLSRAQGPMMEAIRTELRAAYGVFAGAQNYHRDGRFAYIYAEVEGDKLAQSIDVMRSTYEDFRTAETIEAVSEVSSDIAARVKERSEFVDVAAQTMLQSMLDGFDPNRVETLADEFAGATEAAVREQLQTGFAAGDDLIVIAIGPDRSAWPGACVITSLEEVLSCPR